MNTQHNQIEEIKRRKQGDNVFVATNNTNNNNANFSNVQQKENAQHSQYAQYVQNKTKQTYSSSPQIQQNLSQNGVKVKKRNSILAFLLFMFGLAAAAFVGLGLLGASLSEKFNEVTCGGGWDMGSHEDEQWWE